MFLYFLSRSAIDCSPGQKLPVWYKGIAIRVFLSAIPDIMEYYPRMQRIPGLNQVKLRGIVISDNIMPPAGIKGPVTIIITGLLLHAGIMLFTRFPE